jgi:hypothetical protein
MPAATECTMLARNRWRLVYGAAMSYGQRALASGRR